LRLKRSGIIAVAVYLCIAALLLTLGYFSGDPKGRVFFFQLALFPAGLLITLLGLWEVVYSSNFLGNPVVFAILSVLTAYGFGHALGALFGKMKNKGIAQAQERRDRVNRS
jgi:hypothetical protein